MTLTATQPLIHVHESELADWYNVGWHYVGPSPTKSDYVVIEWQQNRPAVQPFRETVNDSDTP